MNSPGTKRSRPSDDLLAVHLEVGVHTPETWGRQRDAGREAVASADGVNVNVAGEVAPDEDQVEWRLVVPGVEPRERLAVAFERHGKPPASAGVQRARSRAGTGSPKQ